MGNNVYTYNEARQAERYTKTTDSIEKYIQREYTHGQDIVDALSKGSHLDHNSYKPEENVKKESTGTVTPLTRLEEMILSGEVKNYLMRKVKYTDNCNKTYGLILGQCTQGVKNKLESEQCWDTIHAQHDPIELLKLIKQVTLNYQDSKYTYKSIFKTMNDFHSAKQYEGESLTDYVKRYKILKDLMEIHHGPLQFSVHITSHPDLKPNLSNQKDLTKVAYNKYVAYAFLHGLDTKRHGNLVTELDNQWAMGDDKFPKDLSAAVTQAAHYKDFKSNSSRHRNQQLGAHQGDSEEETNFAQQGRGKGGAFDKEAREAFLAKAICRCCGEQGHTSPHCQAIKPKYNQDQEGSSNAQEGHEEPESKEEDKEKSNSERQGNFMMSSFGTNFLNMHAQPRDECFQASGSYLNGLKDQVLLDNQSTTDIFCNKMHLTNIRDVDETLHLNTNAGVLITKNQKADYGSYTDVWYNPEAITNIISWSNAKKRGYTIETKLDEFILTQPQTGRSIRFQETTAGLHVAQIEDGAAMVTSVKDNRALYSKRQNAGADRAKKLWELITTPTIVDAVKAKTTRSKSNPVITDYVEIPPELIEAHKGIELCVGNMFIDGVGFLLTVSKNVQLVTIRFIPERCKANLRTALDHTFSIYNKAGFEIKTLHADPEFECIRPELEANGIAVNISAAKEHQKEAERMIRTVKEWYRSLYHGCPYSM